MASCLAWLGHFTHMKRFLLFQKKNNRTTLILRPASVHQSECVVCARATSIKLQLLNFNVTPFKIDQNKNQNRSIDEVQLLRKERR